MKLVLIGLGVGATALVGYNYFKNLTLTNANLEITPTGKIDKFNLTGLQISLDIRLKNPNAGTFKIKYPFIKLQYGSTVIGSSQTLDKDITIPANGEVVINGIIINVSILSLMSLAYNMYKDLKEGKSIKLKVTTITTIQLGWKNIPYEKTEFINIKK